MLSKYKKQQGKKSLMSLSTVLGLSTLSLILNMAPATSHAETLQMPVAPTPKSYSVTLPGRGMSMTEVLEKFGEPEVKEPEVGEPPITRWVYPNYVVIFEYQYVIHSLTTNKPMGFMPPKPAEPEATEKTESGETTQPITGKASEMESSEANKPAQQDPATPHGH